MANADSGTAQGSAEAPGTTQLAQAQGEPIGQISSATGPVHVTHADGTSEDLAVGGQIHADDVIQTPQGVDVAITFVDGTQFSLGGGAEMKIDKLIYDPSGSDNALALNVVQGAFVFVTGGIAGAPGEGMTVATPAGSIGVRGTSVGGQHLEGPDGWVFALFRDENGHVGKVVVYNAKGEVVLDEQFESTKLIDFNTPPSSPAVLTKEEIQQLFGEALEQLPDLLLQNEEKRTELEFETAAGPNGHWVPNQGHFWTPAGFGAFLFNLFDLTLPPSVLEGTRLGYNNFLNNGHNPDDKQLEGGTPLLGLALGGGELPENSPSGTVAGFVAAIVGGPPNATYTYSLVDQEGQQTLQLFSARSFALFAEPEPAFTIDPNTGVITVNNPALLDYETTHGFHLIIHAQNNFGQSVNVPFDIQLDDVNDNAPVIDPLGPIDLAENSAAGTVVGTVTSTDADTTGGPTQYSIVPSSDPDGLFHIDPATGVITLTEAGAASPLLDYESGIHSITLQVAATDGTNAGTPIDVEIDITNLLEPVWSISGASTVTEGGTAVYFVSYSGETLAPGQVLTIDVAPGSGSAIVGSDLVGGTTTLTFTGGGETSQSIAVTTIDDTIIEGTENFSVSIANPNAGTIDTPTDNTVLVDNAEPLVWNVTGNSAGLEGSVATYTVSYSGATLADGVTVTVTVSSQSGSATQDQDFGGVDQVLTFTGGGETFQTITVPLLADSTVEDPENFTVRLASDTGNTGEATTTTVIDDPSQPIAWSLSGSSAVEEGQDAVYTISYTGGPIAPGAAATVTIASGSGSAVEGDDFAGLTTVLTFSGGDPTSQTIAISVNADTVIEGTEDYSVAITGVGGGSVESGSVTTEVIDETSGPVWSISGDSTVAEGSEATYTVSYSDASLAPGQTVLVTVDTNPGSADEDDDYDGQHTVLTFTGGGETFQTVSVQAATDTLVEGTEDYSVSITPSLGDIGTGTATTEIVDQTSGPVWSVSGDSTVTEGSDAVYTVSYSGASLAPGQTAFVTVDTNPGSADEDDDYDGQHTVLTFTGGGETFQTVSVHADADTVIEGTEDFSVAISPSTGDTGTESVTTGIIDDTSGPVWSISGDSTVTEGSDATYTVSYGGASLAPGQTVFVTVDTNPGSADEDDDYDGQHTVLTFTGGGDSFQTVAVHADADTVIEGTEDFSVAISPSTGDTGTGSVSTEIIDDTSGPVWSIDGESTVNEGSDTTYTVSYSGASLAPGQTAFVTVDTNPGSADEDDDYDGQHTVLTFTGGGETFQTLAV
ncbi:MAG TPA: Calx-beta domain-containing protein, partial [Hypericibacter adhaerens]|uniref:Calx-beta domain-containing protein n=1 Tax=Hypericibacter adhaerens TaxID=2602016 RepID=UPI002B65FE08